MAGYQDYMQWVIALLDGGGDPQEDHEVSVIKIGTNHCLVSGPNNTCAQFDNSRYYDDDVLYFEDHGASAFTPISALLFRPAQAPVLPARLRSSVTVLDRW
jgi:hypothetical protein